jgi:hypothetical protein
MAVFWVVVPCSLGEVIRANVLTMEAASTSETSVNFSQTTRHNNPEDSHLLTRRCENLKSHLPKFAKYYLDYQMNHEEMGRT